MSVEQQRRYPAYKQSGNLLLGDVPTEWKVSRIAHVFVKSNAGEVIDKNYWGDGKELLYTCNRTPLKSDFSEFPNWKRTVTNDLLLTRNGTPYVHKPTEGAIYSNVVQRITLAKEYSRDYLSYCLGNSALGMRGYGVSIESFNFDNWKSLRFTHPPLKEQTQIAKFLDYETGKMDALIEKQQQLIRLLKEKRQAVISHAVTKGLNPDAPLRDSGIPWLGEIPAHWEVKRLKHLLAEPLRNGVSPQAAETGGVLTFSIAAVRDGVVNIESHLKHADISTQFALPYRVLPDDVMMMRGNGSRDLVGSVGVVKSLPPEGCIYPDILIRLRFSEEIDSRLAVLFLNSKASRPQVAMGAKTAAGIWKVSGATVAEFAVPVPPPLEQDDIRDYLDLAVVQVDILVARVELQVELLQERRTALISAAVTGKIDVRNWQPPAPQTQTEPA